jgi:hypothetical protein
MPSRRLADKRSNSFGRILVRLIIPILFPFPLSSGFDRFRLQLGDQFDECFLLRR